MDSTPTFLYRISGAFLVLLWASACTHTPLSIESPIEAPAPIDVVELGKPAEPVVTQPRAVAKPAKPVFVPLPPVAIVMSSRDVAYESVVKELSTRLPTFVVYDLSDKSQTPAAAFSRIHDANSAAVVAIGLQAARAAVNLSTAPVIFSQVFNYQDFDLVTKNSRGVSPIAPIDAQVSAWKELDPSVSRIGIIIGPDHDDLIAAAQASASKLDIELVVREASSDQETLFHFKRMMREIDGFWLFPDNRILSGRVLKQLLSDAARRNIAVLVPNESLLEMGAAVSITAAPSDVANVIASLVRLVQDKEFSTAPSISGLSTFDIAVNNAVLRRRGVRADASTSGQGGLR